MWSRHGVVIVIESMVDGWGGGRGSGRGYVSINVNISIIYINVSVNIFNISIGLLPTLMERLHRCVLIQLLGLVSKM